MCGRFTFAVSPELLAETFGVPILRGLTPRYNIAPTQKVLAVRMTEEGKEAAFMHWGLIPSWAKDRSIGSRMINARSESVHERPAFRQLIRHRRCIIPASGFFEWREEGDGKQPFYVRLKEGSLMGFAGLWDRWHSPEGADVESCSILTTSCNALIRPLHDRMPVILQPSMYDFWLDLRMTDPKRLKSIYRPWPEETMEMYPVTSLVNSPRHDSARCIEPLGGAGTSPFRKDNFLVTVPKLHLPE